MTNENNNIAYPKVIFGTSALGNLYKVLDIQAKHEIVRDAIAFTEGRTVFDSAGKYGAGLALESLGQCLEQLSIHPDDVLISNKLGWFRVPLTTDEPTFEPGVWRELAYDAIQNISYQGILDCFSQGNQLLGLYSAKMVSVHDPDEYLSAATDAMDAERRYNDIKEAYRALHELKAAGDVVSVGVGSKDWRVIRRLSEDIELDWVMIANSFTLHSHPAELLRFMEKLNESRVKIINSAVFNGGFLIGGAYYNYKPVDPSNSSDRELLNWRERFFKNCERHQISPAQACICFGLSAPGVTGIALNTTDHRKVQENIAMANSTLPRSFWNELKNEGLIQEYYNYL